MAEDADDPSTFDRGMAPFVLQHRLKASHDALGPHSSLEGLTVGVRLTKPGLRLVKQPHHAQFVVYAIPDDVAALFDCESSFALSAPVKRAYGNYVGATFYIKGTGTETPLALLWGRDRGYWQIVSWLTEPEGDRELPANVPPATNSPQRISADTTLVDAARGFLDSWLVRKDYDKAFAYLSPGKLFVLPAHSPIRSVARDVTRRTPGAKFARRLRKPGTRSGAPIGWRASSALLHRFIRQSALWTTVTPVPSRFRACLTRWSRRSTVTRSRKAMQPSATGRPPTEPVSE
jgi:hypothetical protein